MNDQLLIRILNSTIEDLTALGSCPDYEFDDPDARELAQLNGSLTHKAKFFRANKRISQLSELVSRLEKAQKRQNHEF